MFDNDLTNSFVISKVTYDLITSNAVNISFELLKELQPSVSDALK